MTHDSASFCILHINLLHNRPPIFFSAQRNYCMMKPRLILLVLLVSCIDAFLLRRPRSATSLLLNDARTGNNIGLGNPSKALERTKAQLEKLQRQRLPTKNDPPDPLGAKRQELYQSFLSLPANALKEMLKERKLPRKGRKPDLASRLAAFELHLEYGVDTFNKNEESDVLFTSSKLQDNTDEPLLFCGILLSTPASQALRRAGFTQPTPIQAAAIPMIRNGESVLLHAQTGSGKTLAYLLPILEQLTTDARSGVAVVLVPTRELAAQVAGVATALCSPGSVRLISQPTNLLKNPPKQRGLDEHGVLLHEDAVETRVIVGSAKAIVQSLYGDGIMPAPPTSKPEAVVFLKSVQWLVLDEVDRLLLSSNTSNKQHEKPAAMVAAAVARQTLGKAQVVAASATVGRSLRRELARVLGLLPHECPKSIVVRGGDTAETTEENTKEAIDKVGRVGQHVGRAVTIPDTVQHYIYSSNGSSSGTLLTEAYELLHALSNNCRILLVLTRGFGISTQHAIGALRHFGCQPEPQSLLDVLEADGSEHRMEKHHEISGASGVGQSSMKESGYIYVTGEDTVRGLHLDGLDVVLVIGRPNGPDEYCHIAGRTGRAGMPGKVINIVSKENAQKLSSWERMLECEFITLKTSEDALNL
jgi:hypothetical protein